MTLVHAAAGKNIKTVTGANAQAEERKTLL